MDHVQWFQIGRSGLNDRCHMPPLDVKIRRWDETWTQERNVLGQRPRLGTFAIPMGFGLVVQVVDVLHDV